MIGRSEYSKMIKICLENGLSHSCSVSSPTSVFSINKDGINYKAETDTEIHERYSNSDGSALPPLEFFGNTRFFIDDQPVQYWKLKPDGNIEGLT